MNNIIVQPEGFNSSHNLHLVKDSAETQVKKLMSRCLEIKNTCEYINMLQKSQQASEQELYQISLFPNSQLFYFERINFLNQRLLEYKEGIEIIDRRRADIIKEAFNDIQNIIDFIKTEIDSKEKINNINEMLVEIQYCKKFLLKSIMDSQVIPNQHEISSMGMHNTHYPYNNTPNNQDYNPYYSQWIDNYFVYYPFATNQFPLMQEQKFVQIEIQSK